MSLGGSLHSGVSVSADLPERVGLAAMKSEPSRRLPSGGECVMWSKQRAQARQGALRKRVASGGKQDCAWARGFLGQGSGSGVFLGSRRGGAPAARRVALAMGPGWAE